MKALKEIIQENISKIKVNQWNEIIFGSSGEWSLHRILFYGCLFVVLIGIALIEDSQNQMDEQKEKRYEKKSASYDTYIPKGFSLIPIEIENIQALSSFLEESAIVDLYFRQGTKSRLVAKQIRLLRAPKNPKIFAVLAPRAQVKKVYDYQGPFLVSIIPRDSGGTSFESKKPSRLKVDYFEEKTL